MLKFLLVAALFGILVYLTVRLVERRGRRSAPRPPKPRQRPLGPDDDPDFLWNLDKKKRHPEDPDPPSGA